MAEVNPVRLSGRDPRPVEPLVELGRELGGDGRESLVLREPFPWPAAAQALALLGAEGASVGLFVGMVTAPWPLSGYLTKNTVTTQERAVFLTEIAAAVIVPMLLAIVWLLRGGRRAVPAVQRASELLAPLAVVFALPMLLVYQAWHSEPLPFLVALGAFGLLLERSLVLSMAAVPTPMQAYLGERLALSPRARRRAALGVVLAAAAGYSVYMGYYTLLNHRRFGTAGFDLGIYDNLMYNALHGSPFRSPVLFGPDGGNYLAGHAEFAMLLFLPLYALHPGSDTLLVLQAAVLGFSAVPLYLFAATQVPRWSAACLAVCYLFFAPLHGPQFYDFHWLPLAIFFHFSLYYALAKERYGLAWAAVVVLWLIREDVAVGLSILGVFLLFTGLRPRFGGALSALSAVWFVVDKFVIMRWAGSWWFANMYKDLIVTGEEGYGSVVRTLITNPTYSLSTLLKENKVIYTLHLFAPLLFLPWRRWPLLFLAIPGFFFTLMTTDYAPTLSIAFQYTTHWIPYLFLSSALALRLVGAGPLGALRRRGAVLALSAAVLVHSYVFGAILQHHVFVGGFASIIFQMTADERTHYAEFKQIAALIPPTATLAVGDNELPHLSARPLVYSLKDHHGDADYLLVDRRHLGVGNTRKVLGEATKRDSYGLLAHRLDYYLFKKDHVSPETPAAFSDLGLPAPARSTSRP